MTAALIRARRSIVERQQKMSAVFDDQTRPLYLHVVFFIFLQIALLPLVIAQFVVELPIHLRSHSMEAFSLMALRDQNGSFLESYQSHLRRLRFSVATLMLSVVAVGSLMSFFAYGIYAGIPSPASASGTITVSGTLYSNEGVTAIDCSSVSHTVKLRVNGAGSYSGTCTLNTGAYSIAGVTVNSGDVITVWISGATEKATTVTRASTSDISGLNLYGNAIIVRHEDAGPISNTNLGQCDSVNGAACTDADIKFSVSAGALTIASGSELYVWTGKSYTPGGSFTTNATGGGLHVASSATVTVDTDSTVAQNIVVDSSGTISISATKTLTNSGTTDVSNAGTISGAGTLRFTSSTTGGPGTGGTISSIVRFDASGGNVPAAVVDTRTYGGDLEFYSNVAAVRTITPSTGTYTISGNLKVITGSSQSSTLTVTGVANGPAMNVSGNLSFTKGGSSTPSISTGAMAMTISGNFTTTNGTFTTTTGSAVTLNGAGTTLTSASTFYNLNISANGVSTATSNPSISHMLTVNVGSKLTIPTNRTLNILNTAAVTLNGEIAGAGMLFYQSSGAFPSTGTISAIVNYTPLSNSVTITSRTYGGDVQCNDSGSSLTTCTLAAGTIFNGNLLLGDIGTGVVLDGATNNPNITLAGSLTESLNTGGVTVSMGGGTWSVGGNFDLSNVTTFNSNGGLLNMNGTGTLTTNGKTLTNLSTSGSGTVTFANAPITVAGNLNLGASATLVPGTSEIIMTGGGKTITDNGQALYDLTSSAGSVSVVDANLTVHSLTVSGGTFTAPSAMLTINGNFTRSSGTFFANGGTVSMATATAATISGTTTFQNFSSTVAGKSIKFVAASGGTPVFTVAGAMTLTGSSGSHMSLSSDTPGSRWLAHFSGTQSAITNTNILDSGCDTGTANVNLDATSLNAGDNGACWVFTTPSLTVNDGAGADATYTTSTTTLAGNWSVTDATGVDHYEYAIGMTVGGTDIVNYTSTVLVTNFTNASLTLSSGTTYYIAVRAKNTFGVVMASANSNGILDDSVAPTTISTVNDGAGADVTWTTSATTLSANWTASSDATSGLQKYQYAIGTTSGGTQTLGWTNNGLTTNVTNSGLTLVDGTTYYISVRAVDQANNVGGVTSSNGATVNTLLPTIVDNQLGDAVSRNAAGTTYSVQFFKSATGPRLQSGEYAVYRGPSKSGTQLKTWTSIFSTPTDSYITPWSIDFSSLQEGINYISVRTTDLNSLVAETDDVFTITKDTVPPAIASSRTSVTTTSAIISWTTSEPATSSVAYGTTSSYGTTRVAESTLATAHTIALTGLTPATTYHYQLTMVDAAGNSYSTTDQTVTTSSATVPATVQTSVPTVATPILPSLPNQPLIMVGLGKAGQTITVYANGKAVGSEKLLGRIGSTQSYAIRISLGSLPNGKITFTVKASDARGHVATSLVTMTFTFQSSGATKTLRPDANTAGQYTVKAGNSLWKIATRYYRTGMSYGSLVRANVAAHPSLALHPNIIQPGWVLVIPSH